MKPLIFYIPKDGGVNLCTMELPIEGPAHHVSNKAEREYAEWIQKVKDTSIEVDNADYVYESIFKQERLSNRNYLQAIAKDHFYQLEGYEAKIKTICECKNTTDIL